MKAYKALDKQEFHRNGFRIVPLRHEDRYLIMEWRNQQIYHLRQRSPLTKEEQDAYFENVVSGLFNQEQPSQILFSYLKGEECIGYGGLVHLNWIDRHAEVSFIMKTELQDQEFGIHWSNFLKLLKQVAFSELGLHKIFTYAFDLRPHLYRVLEKNGFKLEARLKEHCFYDGKFRDVLIHAHYDRKLILREANLGDLDLTFNWARNPDVRRFANNQKEIVFAEHELWFKKKLADSQCLYFIANYNTHDVGTLRIDIDHQGTGLISYLIDPNFHGLGLGTIMVKAAIESAQKNPTIKQLTGEVWQTNIASLRIFEKVGFKELKSSEGVLTYQINTQ